MEELTQANFHKEQKGEAKKKQNAFLSGAHQIGFKKKESEDAEEESNDDKSKVFLNNESTGVTQKNGM